MSENQRAPGKKIQTWTGFGAGLAAGLVNHCTISIPEHV